MANVNETPTWSAGVYQIETSDPVLGGPDGVSNKQAKDLANRTAYLKKQIEEHLDVDKADAGTLNVAHGGTGRGTLTAGSYLRGAGSDAVELLTPIQVLADLKGVPYFTSVPPTNVAPIIQVVGLGEMWWTVTAYFTGYRSPNCGRLDFGWTPTPLSFQVEAIGNTLTEAAHAGLIARFRESGLVVPIGSWVKGEYKIADMGSGNWKAPDMRDQFLRFTGTDADTANARQLGSKQVDAMQNITGSITFRPSTAGGVDKVLVSASGAFLSTDSFGGGPVQLASGGTTYPTQAANFSSDRVARTSIETRGPNMAFNPVICL